MFTRIVMMAMLWPSIAIGQTCGSSAPAFHWVTTGLDPAFEAAGQRYRIDPDLGRAMAWVESRVTATAISPKGAQGIMQLMPGTSDAMRVSDPFNSHQSIYGGMAYLHQIITIPRFVGDLYMALVAYNAGPNRGAFPAVSYQYADTVIAVYWRLKLERRGGSPIGYLRVPRCGRHSGHAVRMILIDGKLAPSRHY
jgi:soluble lytic murein transglycosylase-like protein